MKKNKKRKKRTLLENIQIKNKKAEKVKEEKNRIEQEEARIRQEQTEFLKSIYDVVLYAITSRTDHTREPGGDEFINR